ncbi:hypothetical protein QTI66_02435 [Variovorax sp. J22R133]|uniref:hypothetical protein n=1 Tax=Variovorax brevis TaxID=3053503 RepID=UPI002578D1E3|nr:hypothetical protein [Variovorax sp. J22R133]MDM0110984.1 hypothetical protein [Variovorax sp. J22R133]
MPDARAATGLWRFVHLAALSALLVACGGDSGSDAPDGPAFTVGGSVTGLGLNKSLQVANGRDSLFITVSGPFTMPTPVATGQTYEVTVSQQPLGQFCSVANGTGTMGSQNAASVVVFCVNA